MGKKYSSTFPPSLQANLLLIIIRYRQPGQAAVVDISMTRKENANLKEYHEAIRSQTSIDGGDLPLRPAYADKGLPITLLANYLQVTMTDTQQLFTYEAVLDERLHNKRQRHQFIETALKFVPELKDLGEGIATDYASLVVTSTKVSLGLSETKTFVIEYYDTEIPEGRVLAKDRPFKLTLSLAGTTNSADLSCYIMSGPADSSESVDSDSADTKAVRTLNIVMQSHPNKEPGVYQGGQNKFFCYPTDLDTFKNYDLLGSLIAIRGYYSSIRFSTSRTLLNLNAQCSPFYKSINVRELIQGFQKLTPGNWQALEHFLKRLRVKTSYMKASDGSPIQKVKTINGLSHKIEQDPVAKKTRGNADLNHGNAMEIKFKRTGLPLEGPISIRDYFRTGEYSTSLKLDGTNHYSEYGLTLSHPTDYVLNCGMSRKSPFYHVHADSVVFRDRRQSRMDTSRALHGYARAAISWVLERDSTSQNDYHCGAPACGKCFTHHGRGRRSWYVWCTSEHVSKSGRLA